MSLMLKPIEELVTALTKQFSGAGDHERIRGMLGEYSTERHDWRRFALFAERSYTRNLVAKNVWFELLVLCWSGGNVSPIHNHAGQSCWMAVLDGTIEETHYDCPAEGHVGPLTMRETFKYQRGDACYIHDSIALHNVRASGEGKAVSLHIYARPFAWCNIYCPDTGTVGRKNLKYDSRDGVRL